jgi:hypothetical protein
VFLETASERAEFPVQAGNDISAKWPSEGMRATDRAPLQRLARTKTQPVSSRFFSTINLLWNRCDSLIRSTSTDMASMLC